jgi:hypothetical protein
MILLEIKGFGLEGSAGQTATLELFSQHLVTPLSR